MDDTDKLLTALRTFGQKAGEDAYKYIAFDALLKNQPLLKRLRLSVEYGIAQEFLPGFRFRSLDRFAWHLKHEQFLRRHLLGEKIPPSKFQDHWIRRFLLPNRFHYIAEIARTFQDQAEHRRQQARQLELPVPRISWLRQMRRWIKIDDLSRGFDKRPDSAENWYSLYCRSSEDTYFHWARQAKTYRAVRRRQRPFNGWYVHAILYSGGQLHDVDKIQTTVAMIDTGYLEVWKWASQGRHPAPRRTELSFMLPAAPDSWRPPDRQFRLPLSSTD